MKKLIYCVMVYFYLLSSIAYANDLPTYVIDIAWHPDGTKLALSIGQGRGCGPIEALKDIQIIVISYPSLKTLYTIKPQRACTIDALEWSNDGQFLLFAETNHDAFIWQISTQQVISRSKAFYEPHQRYMDKIKPNGEIVANTTFAIGLTLWDMQTGQPIDNSPTIQDVYGVSWSPDGTKLVVGSGSRCSIFETSTYTSVFTFACMADNPLWSPDGQWIVTSTPETDYLWNAKTLTLERSWNNDHNGSYNTQWSPDSQYLANVHADQTLSVTRVPDGSEIYTQFLPYPTMTLAWSPDGNTIVYGGDMTNDNPLGIGFINRSMFDSSGFATSTLSKGQ